jgi:hypothetical protein
MGFEPTRLVAADLETNTLDHSAIAVAQLVRGPGLEPRTFGLG